ncbi:hypothetical protein HU200_019610 [Digitaria exilis]|uniref:RBR-type E3 ubiquitin transferase n=1 Tax=Digitaria exilis TaxID=1010633 RepID=A0A835F3J4_9POAL|nr:hypothetical protein HU200_019610 [Digitaria exilis]CAB3460313.1 unnamed protein product [Digitaria exilis]
MATATGDGGAISGRYKRCQTAGDLTEDGGDNTPDKRCRVAVAGDDGETGGDTGDYYKINGDETDNDGGGEDLIYYYSDADEEDEAEVVAAASTTAIQPPEQSYVVLSEAAIRDRQIKATVEVAEVLSLPHGFAAALLRHYKWRPTRLKEEWFSDANRHIRHAVGFPPVPFPVATALSREPLACAICFGTFATGETRSAACSSHFYCDECWRGYIHAAVSDGHGCLSLRCPDPSCSAAVAMELVDEVADADDRARYAQFALRSFVDDNGGGGRIKWCPGPGCARAVEFLGDAAAEADVVCECAHAFCWSCGEEAHRPVSCATVRAWMRKNTSDSASATWVLANTKHCPKCRRPIEKNQGCNHMRCRAPCNHYFCWICLEPLGRGHTSCNGYRPQRQQQLNAGGNVVVLTPEEQRQGQAKASLDRYLYHYERWVANHKSLQEVLKDVAALEPSELEKMAATMHTSTMDLKFLTKAYEQIAGCRRVLRWAYAYGYFLDPERDAAKRGLFDHLMNDANRSLERLHGCAEGERKRLCATANCAPYIAERYKSYKKKLGNLTEVTRHYFENLVKAFETDLAEVKPAK